MDPKVAEVFRNYPPLPRKRLKELRKLIIEVSKSLPEIGRIEESLKWGEPSYRPILKGIGTTVRIHWKRKLPDKVGIYFNCNTSLVSTFKKKYKNLFKYEGKRAIVFSEQDEFPIEEIKECIEMALTYHILKTK